MKVEVNNLASGTYRNEHEIVNPVYGNLSQHGNGDEGGACKESGSHEVLEFGLSFVVNQLELVEGKSVCRCEKKVIGMCKFD